MKNYTTQPIIYEYRYANVSEPTRQEIISKRYSLFARGSQAYGRKSRSNSFASFLAIVAIITMMIVMSIVIAGIV